MMDEHDQNILAKDMKEAEARVVAAAPRLHHPFSPSKLQSMEACSCYESKSGGSAAALKGALQHGVVESGADNPALADEDVAAAATCIDFFARQKQLMVEAACRNSPASQPSGEVQEFDEIYLAIDEARYLAPVFNEVSGGFDWQTVHATTAGYIDKGLLSHCGTYAELFDWKFGRWPVEEAKNNMQGVCYVLGFFRKFPRCLRIRFYFLQPALNRIDFHYFHRDDIPALELRVKVVVARKIEANVRGDFSLASPKIPVCNFCARIGRCNKVAEFACLVGRRFHPVEIPVEITPTMIQSPEQTVLGLRLASVLVIWAEAFKRQVNDRILRGEAQVPAGYSLQSKSDRAVVDAKLFLEVTRQHVTQEELEAAADYGFGKLEKAISDNSPRGQKAGAIQRYRTALLESGAVVNGPKYTFLCAEPK